MSFAGFTDAEKEQYRTRQTDAKESLLILHSMAAGLSSTSPTNDWWGNVSENDRRVLENLYYRARHVGFPAEYSWGASLGIEQLALLSALPDDIPVKVELIKSAAEASTSNDEAVTSLVEELQTSQESDRDKRLISFGNGPDRSSRQEKERGATATGRPRAHWSIGRTSSRVVTRARARCMRSCQGSVLGLHSTGAAGSRGRKRWARIAATLDIPEPAVGTRQSFLGDRGYMQNAFRHGDDTIQASVSRG
jgi:hypothetical protein